MSDEQAIYGTPSMVLMPSSKYKFTVSEDVYSIELPNSGTYHELDPEFFSEEEGSFEIFNDEGVVNLPTISKVLFATKKYPALGVNQVFAPLGIHIEEDKVTLIGHVIDMLTP